jgi:hypothetical protein
MTYITFVTFVLKLFPLKNNDKKKQVKVIYHAKHGVFQKIGASTPRNASKSATPFGENTLNRGDMTRTGGSIVGAKRCTAQ